MSINYLLKIKQKSH